MAFDTLLIHSVTISPYLGDGPMGATYGASRVIQQVRVVLASKANRIGQVGTLNYNAQIFIPANEPIIENSQIIWTHPITLTTIIWKVIEVKIASDSQGVHHQEILVI